MKFTARVFRYLFIRQLHTEIEIHTDALVVWNIISDFNSYAKWNTFIPRAEGAALENHEIRILMNTGGKSLAPYKVKITEVEVPKKLKWLGHFFVPGLIDGHHAFEILPVSADRVVLIHSETFRGLLVPFTWNFFLNTKLRRGFIEMNDSIKLQAEQHGFSTAR